MPSSLKRLVMDILRYVARAMLPTVIRKATELAARLAGVNLRVLLVETY